MSTRYVIEGAWRTVSAVQVVRNSDGAVQRVIREVADLRDSHSGHTYDSGAYRVRVDGTKPVPRAKVFKGETAWYKAESYERDVIYSIRFAVRVM